MFAVIKTGGKQYRVEPGTVLEVEKIEAGIGQSIDFQEVLLVSDGEDTKVGQPHVAGAKVSAEVVEQGKGPKLVVFKKRRRQDSQLKKGHRQQLTRVRISEISVQ